VSVFNQGMATAQKKRISDWYWISHSLQYNVDVNSSLKLMYQVETLSAVKSTYKEPAYKELLVIRNWFQFLNHYQGTSSIYVYKELWL